MMLRAPLRALGVLLVAVVTTAGQESGSITVTSADAPAAGIDIFLFVNQGKQPLGSTNQQGSLPFDPALLSGKLKGETVSRTCSARTEIILVAEGESYRCETTDENGERCECDPLGLWLFSNGRISLPLQNAKSTSLARNPVFLGVLGGGAVTAIVVAGGGSDSSSTPSLSSTPSTGTSGGTTTGGSTTSGGTATSSATSLNGSYPGNFMRLRDECNFFVPSFNGTAVVTATPTGALTVQVIESIVRTYQGMLTVTSEGNGTGTASGSNSIGNIPINGEVQLSFMNGRLTIDETMRMPQNGNCAATFRGSNLARQ